MDTHIENVDSVIDQQRAIEQYLAKHPPDEWRQFISENLIETSKSDDRRTFYEVYGTGLYLALTVYAGALYVIALVVMTAGVMLVSLWCAATKPAYRLIWWRAFVSRWQTFWLRWRKAGVRHA